MLNFSKWTFSHFPRSSSMPNWVTLPYVPSPKIKYEDGRKAGRGNMQTQHWSAEWKPLGAAENIIIQLWHFFHLWPLPGAALCSKEIEHVACSVSIKWPPFALHSHRLTVRCEWEPWKIDDRSFFVQSITLPPTTTLTSVMMIWQKK